MIHLIAGRTASGKDTLADILKTKHDMNIVKSRTTRPKRSEDDDSHIFVDEETARKEIPNSIAHTCIDRQDYYAMPEDIKGKQCYVVDIIGAQKLAKAMPDENLHVIYVATSEEERHARFIERITDKEHAEELWVARNESEDEQFTDFEEAIAEDRAIEALGHTQNIRRLSLIVNNGDMETFIELAQSIADYRKVHEKLKRLADLAVENKLLETDKNGRVTIFNAKTHEPAHVSTDIMTGVLQSRPEDLATIIEWALINTDLLDKIPSKV